MHEAYEHPDQLPNWHLSHFVAPDFYRMDADAQLRDLRRAHLAAAGLPADYDRLSRPNQRLARYAGLRGWFDETQPNVLCTDVDKLVQAHYLWVEEYIKKSQRNRGVYYFRDPKHKYRMVRAALSPPKVASEPAKTLLTAPRGSIKTHTLIQEMVSLMVAVRPFTEILISEINDDRTGEEMQKLALQFEQNECIQADFGGRGELFIHSNRSKLRWNDSQLDFIHLAGNRILGRSFYSAQRGRHVPLRIIDDPEDKNTVRNAGHRQVFLHNLFARDMGMMSKGSHYVWLTTLVLGGVAHMAMESDSGGYELDEELLAAMGDQRFDATQWNKINFDLLIEDEDGHVESIFPDYLDPEEFERKARAIGYREAMSEYRGIATAAGEFALIRDSHRHGYLRCEENARVPGRYRQYLFDLRTGAAAEWSAFVASLYICGAVDLADSTKANRDYGAVVVLGVDPDGVHYVLDALIARMIAPLLLWNAFELCARWKAQHLGIEKAGGMSNVLYRAARTYRRKLETQGQVAPFVVPISCDGQSKVQRMLTVLRPLYDQDLIRFPRFERTLDSQGIYHQPVEHTARGHIRALLQQLDLMTEAGSSLHDDGPDALHMAVRVAAGRRGETPPTVDENERELRAWQEAGVDWTHSGLPPAVWTDAMWERRNAVLVAAAAEPDVPAAYFEDDPYE